MSRPRNRHRAVLGMCIAVALVTQAAAAAGTPTWVRPTAERTAQRWFGAKPVRLDAVDLQNRIAVVATFPAEVRCGPCSRPPSAAGMRGRIFRFSLDRKTRTAWHGNTLSIRRCASRPACYGGAPHTTLQEAVAGSSVLRDILDGRLERVWSCASLRAAVDGAPKDVDRSKAIETLHAATVKACGVALAALARGDSPQTVRAVLGAPDRTPRCWLYAWPGTRASPLVGARICFADDRVALIERSVHG